MKIYRFTRDLIGTVSSRSYTAPVEVVADVNISETASRRCELSGEDCISVQFSLAEPIYFEIGDFAIINVVEGDYDGGVPGDAFAVAAKTTPTYNVNTGGYDYDLQLDAYYLLLRHKIAMLSYPPEGRVNPVRFETQWKYTETLKGHADILQNNINALRFAVPQFIRSGEAVCWLPLISMSSLAEDKIPTLYRKDREDFIVTDGTSTKNLADEYRYIDYTGTNIMDAIRNLTNEENYNCEFWYEGNSRFILHLGYLGHKMTQDELRAMRGVIIAAPRGDVGQADKFALSISARDSEREYYNRLRLYGSTRNMPENYGKKMVLYKRNPNASEVPAWPFKDANGLVLHTDVTMWSHREIKSSEETEGRIEFNFSGGGDEWQSSFIDFDCDFGDQPNGCQMKDYYSYIDGIVGVRIGDFRSISFELVYYDNYTEYGGVIWRWNSHEHEGEMPVAPLWILPSKVNYGHRVKFRLICKLALDVAGEQPVYIPVHFKATGDYSNMARVNLRELDTQLQPTGVTYGMSVYGSSGDDKKTSVIFGFDEAIPEGKRLTTDNYNAANTDWPVSIFSVIGERAKYSNSVSSARLGMMSGESLVDYVDSDDLVLGISTKIVEKVEIDESFYPSVEMTNNASVGYRTKYEYMTGRTRTWPSEQDHEESWSMKEEKMDGSVKVDYYEYFVLTDTANTGILDDNNGITTDWLIQGETLTVRFNSGMLAGMEFEAAILTRATQTQGRRRVIYIIPNDKYGQVLPNSTLYPRLGDDYVLLGWNPLMLAGTNAISIAGNLLFAEAKDRVNNASRDHKTYQVTMEARSLISRENMRWNDARPKPIDDKVLTHLYTRDRYYTNASIQSLGERVRLSDIGLFKETRNEDGWRARNTSALMRIVGVEYKLDIPFDDLKYTVGETPILKGIINTLKNKK